VQQRDLGTQRRLRRRVVLASLLVVLIAALVAAWGYRHFTTFEEPPRGELIAERPSPDGSRLLGLSKIDGGGGAVGDTFYRGRFKVVARCCGYCGRSCGDRSGS
jgi:hypothetical protein